LRQNEEKSVSEAYYDEALPDNQAGHNLTRRLVVLGR